MRFASRPLGPQADRLYDVPDISVTKQTTGGGHSFTSCSSREPDVAVRIPSAEAPPWLARLATHQPRPARPWLKGAK